MIHSDGYCSYIPVLEGYTHEHRSYDPDSGLLHWLHIVISNTKALILGTYHGLPKKYLQSYLDEYSFRFSRRGFGGDLVERLTLSIAFSRSAEQKGYQHKQQRLENRIRYSTEGERKKRSHRLITRGGAVESIVPKVRGMSESAFFVLMEQVFSLPEVAALVSRATDQQEDG